MEGELIAKAVILSPGASPSKLGIPLGDLVGGINGPIGILAALAESMPANWARCAWWKAITPHPMA